MQTDTCLYFGDWLPNRIRTTKAIKHDGSPGHFMRIALFLSSAALMHFLQDIKEPIWPQMRDITHYMNEAAGTYRAESFYKAISTI